MSPIRLKNCARIATQVLAALVCMVLALSAVHNESWTTGERETKKEILLEDSLPATPLLGWAKQSDFTSSTVAPIKISADNAPLQPRNQSIFLPGYGSSDLSPPSLGTYV